MKRVELHAKTKYGYDYDSIIDIEAMLWNALENKERGVVFVDKDSIVAFPKIEKIYKELCIREKEFKKFKIGYGVELTTILNDLEEEIVLLIKNQNGLKNLYKIMSKYLSEFKINIEEILKLQEGLLIGLMLNKENMNLDLSLFDYLEINENINVTNIKKNNIVIFSNKPNAFLPGDIKALELLYFREKIKESPTCRLYLDTEEALKICKAKELVITNPNKIFDNLETITINDEKLHITLTNDYHAFETLVRNSFKKKIKNPYKEIEERLDRELRLIKELNYVYYYETVMCITNYCKENKEYYMLDGYINNSLVAYLLDITEIEPFNLPYELFFSEKLQINLQISPKFYQEKLSYFIKERFKDKLLKCNYSYKLSEISINTTIKQYEKSMKKNLKLAEKDYITDLLNGILVGKASSSNSYFIISENKEIEDFTPFESDDKENKRTHFDYFDLENNLLKITFHLNENIEFISNLRNATNTSIQYCNEIKVYNLFRSTEEFKMNFKILDRTSGLLNISYFDTKELERKLKRIPHLWLEDLLNIIVKSENYLLEDDLYLALKKRNLEDLEIFNVLNYLKEIGKKGTSKATLINKIRISYMQMYYKLYYPKDYYKELLTNISYEYIDNKLFTSSLDNLKQRYLELNKMNGLWLKVEEHQELRLLEIMMEMYERNILFKWKNGKIIIN